MAIIILNVSGEISFQVHWVGSNHHPLRKPCYRKKFGKMRVYM